MPQTNDRARSSVSRPDSKPVSRPEPRSNQGENLSQRIWRGDSYRPQVAAPRRNGAGSDERHSEPSNVKQRSRSPPPPASSNSTREPERRRDSGASLQQSSLEPPAAPPASQPDEIVAGIIMFVPRGLRTGRYSPSRLLRAQQWVNERAAGHPVVVWDTYRHEGELIARCLPMTSFGSRTVEEKYDSPNAWRFWLEYVPIMEQQRAVVSRANIPSLALADGEAMTQRTYVHLDHFFDIEAGFLRMHGRNAHFGRSVHLEDAALSVLVHKFHQFVSGKVQRPTAKLRSPLDYAGPEELARPVLGSAALEKAREGSELEAARRTQTGAYEWTGWEKFGPRQQAEQRWRNRTS